MHFSSGEFFQVLECFTSYVPVTLKRSTGPIVLLVFYTLLDVWTCHFVSYEIGTTDISTIVYHVTQDCGSIFECWGFGHLIWLVVTGGFLLLYFSWACREPPVPIDAHYLPQLVVVYPKTSTGLRLGIALMTKLVIWMDTCTGVSLGLYFNALYTLCVLVGLARYKGFPRVAKIIVAALNCFVLLLGTVSMILLGTNEVRVYWSCVAPADLISLSQMCSTIHYSIGGVLLSSVIAIALAAWFSLRQPIRTSRVQSLKTSEDGELPAAESPRKPQLSQLVQGKLNELRQSSNTDQVRMNETQLVLLLSTAQNLWGSKQPEDAKPHWSPRAIDEGDSSEEEDHHLQGLIGVHQEKKPQLSSKPSATQAVLPPRGKPKLAPLPARRQQPPEDTHQHSKKDRNPDFVSGVPVGPPAKPRLPPLKNKNSLELPPLNIPRASSVQGKPYGVLHLLVQAHLELFPGSNLSVRTAGGRKLASVQSKNDFDQRLDEILSGCGVQTVDDDYSGSEEGPPPGGKKRRRKRNGRRRK